MDLLGACNKTVLTSDYFQYFRLGSFFRLYTDEPVGVTMGAGSLRQLFDESYYTDLDGEILESFGRLFQNNLRIYVYPYLDPDTQALTRVESLKVVEHLEHLYRHLLDQGMIVQLDDYNEECLHIFSRRLLKKISGGDDSWEEEVPEQVSELIKKRGFFGYKPVPC